MTTKAALNWATKKIPLLDAQIILGFVLNTTKESLIIRDEKKLSCWEYLKFKHLIRKKINNTPTAYLTKHKEFFGFDFLVNKHTLVPRPDTELMVEEVIKKMENGKWKMENFSLIDIGCGSGCIPISIIKTLQPKAKQNFKTFATDISSKTLKVAKQNAKKHNVNITFLQGNLLEPTLNFKPKIQNQKLIITANLPYLTEEQFDNETSIQKEPKSALVAEKDGLYLYEKLICQVAGHPELNIKNLFLEIDPAQANKITQLVKKHLPLASLEIKKDLARRDRLVIIEINTLIQTTE